jgi:pyrimidine-nucleoside phosphorylase
MSIIDLIAKKRDGAEWSEKEIEFILHSFVKGSLPDYQMAALLMIIYYQGLSQKELLVWTQTKMSSGSTLDLSDLPGPKIDKHSTGGVGDKTSLIVVPLVASLGVKVPMICGRGLGFTGGTVDKLESIPGFKTDLSLSRAKEILTEIGSVMMEQTDEIVPADKKLYALRDVTATVESIPLIASSILSKKCAEGIDGVVFDVKFGDGSFSPSKTKAASLAKALVNLAQKLKLQGVAVLSSMDQPLGFAIGNALEVEEAIEVMKGKGPKDLRELSLYLAAWVLVLGKMAKNPKEGIKKAEKALDQGLALVQFRRMVDAQGGNSRVIDHPWLFPQPLERLNIRSPKNGFLKKIHTRRIGELLRNLGAGRMRLGELIDPSVGLLLSKKVGDSLSKGESLATLHLSSTSRENLNEKELESLFEITPRPHKPLPLIGPVIR